MIRVEPLTGEALTQALDDLAQLRIKVFRSYPYLYDGDPEYERNYLQAYSRGGQTILVGAYDGDTLIGAATGMPMEDHSSEFADALARADIAAQEVFYCAESVLLPQYRGRGIGHAFFDARESHARRLGRGHAAFCSVKRPDDHPLRPPDYAPLDPFWRKRGYAPLPGAVAQFRWKDVDQPDETDHPLQFWMRRL